MLSLRLTLIVPEASKRFMQGLTRLFAKEFRWFLKSYNPCCTKKISQKIILPRHPWGEVFTILVDEKSSNLIDKIEEKFYVLKFTQQGSFQKFLQKFAQEEREKNIEI